MNKHYWRLILIAGLVFLLLPSLAVGCAFQIPGDGTGSPSDMSGAANQIAKEYADFEVGALTIARSSVTVGEMATVSTTVTNTGGVGGVYKATLAIDGREVDQKDVSVGPGGTAEVTFQVTENVPGSYKLAIGNSEGVLNVYQWPYTIRYDLGSAYGELLSVAGDFGHIVHFSPPATPFRIQKIDVYVQAAVVKESDWRDRFVTLRIWDSSKTRQLWSKDFPWRTFWNETASFWKEIDIPNISVNGDFYVEMVTHSEQFGEEIVAWPWSPEIRPAIFVGYDRPNPYVTSTVSSTETRSGISNMGYPVEVPVKYQGLNWLLRVTGDGGL